MPLMTGIKRSVERHYHKLAETNCNTCDVGTWTINNAEAQAQHTWGKQMKSFFARFKKDTKGFVPCSTSTSTSAAMTCACSLSDDRPSTACSKILVVCKCTAFSDEMMQYAATMASRTHSEIVALSLDEKENDFDQFSAQARTNIKRLAQEAKNLGSHFPISSPMGRKKKSLIPCTPKTRAIVMLWTTCPP